MASGLIQFAFVLASGIINIMPNEVGAGQLVIHKLNVEAINTPVACGVESVLSGALFALLPKLKNFILPKKIRRKEREGNLALSSGRIILHKIRRLLTETELERHDKTTGDAHLEPLHKQTLNKKWVII
ncbi:hypothetical protein ACJJTC_001452 [Scirpophaga incertulas]